LTAFFDDALVLFDDEAYSFDGEVLLNTPPVADAGSDQAITLPTEDALLDGSATDDGIPADPGTLSYLWSLLDGPGLVTFDDATDPQTTAHFAAAGVYTLQLYVTDGELDDTDTVVITVNPAVPATSTSTAWELEALGADCPEACGHEPPNLSLGYPLNDC
jgi:hypothetical protein